MKKIREIKITEKTKNTKALRKRIYQKALQYIKNCIEEDGLYYQSGFCSAIFSVIDISTRVSSYKVLYDLIGKFDLHRESKKSIYTELLKYKPIRNMYGGYWFDTNKAGDEKRIKILETEIANM